MPPHGLPCGGRGVLMRPLGLSNISGLAEILGVDLGAEGVPMRG